MCKNIFETAEKLLTFIGIDLTGCYDEMQKDEEF